MKEIISFFCYRQTSKLIIFSSQCYGSDGELGIAHKQPSSAVSVITTMILALLALVIYMWRVEEAFVPSPPLGPTGPLLRADSWATCI